MNERELLARLIAGPVSGDALARASGQTRAAVWKRIQALRMAGVAIDAQPGRGYALGQPIELLDADVILAALPQAQRDALATLEIVWSIDSTNSELLRRATPAQGCVILLAERQSGGRGRRGRAWASPLAANLYLSVARQFSGGLARLPGLSLVAAVATADALHALGFKQVQLKWPNDLVVAGADGIHKLGGLLVEGGGEHAGPVRAVLGLGLNVRMPAAVAASIEQPCTDLVALAGQSALAGRVPSRNGLAARLLAHWLPALELFDLQGLEPFLPRYQCYDALAGREVTIHTSDDAYTGRALELAADGALRVRMFDGREHSVHAGEVSVGTE